MNKNLILEHLLVYLLMFLFVWSFIRYILDRILLVTSKYILHKILCLFRIPSPWIAETITLNPVDEQNLYNRIYKENKTCIISKISIIQKNNCVILYKK